MEHGATAPQLSSTPSISGTQSIHQSKTRTWHKNLPYKTPTEPITPATTRNGAPQRTADATLVEPTYTPTQQWNTSATRGIATPQSTSKGPSIGVIGAARHAPTTPPRSSLQTPQSTVKDTPMKGSFKYSQNVNYAKVSHQGLMIANDLVGATFSSVPKFIETLFPKVPDHICIKIRRAMYDMKEGQWKHWPAVPCETDVAHWLLQLCEKIKEATPLDTIDSLATSRVVPCGTIWLREFLPSTDC